MNCLTYVFCERLKMQHTPQPKLIAPDTKMLYWLWRTILLMTIVKPSPNRKLEAGTPSSNARSERCYVVARPAHTHRTGYTNKRPRWLQLTVCLASAPINDVLLSTSVDILGSRLEVSISATRKIMNAPAPVREWRIGYAEGPDTAGRHVWLIVQH